MRRLGSFGTVVLLVVMAIVLLLVARSWRSVAPSALAVKAATEVRGPTDTPARDRGPSAPGPAVPSGQLPDLNDMRRSTADHATQVREALEQAE